MGPHPRHLSLGEDNRLLIGWSDGQKRSYSIRELRERCPCATCREKRTQGQEEARGKSHPGAPSESRERKEGPIMLPVLSAAETRPLKLLGMTPVGNYAYSIKFSDGHETGIYTFDLLRELGREEA